MTRYSVTITRERLLEVLDFHPETGQFFWKITRGRAKCGTLAGCVAERYRWIGIDGKIYHAHRLVWLVTYGEWPSHGIDHIDLNGDHNWPSNLRLATDAQNQWNTAAFKNNKSGYKDVFAFRGRWMVLIQKNKKRHYRGMFDSPEEAHAEVVRAVKELHGEYGRST